MYHSVTFIIGNSEIKKNTWSSWHLIPTSRPVFNPPAVKTEYVDVPNSDGVIDFTESLTNSPTYKYREGSIEFIVENGHQRWSDLYSEIMNVLHGKYGKAILEDDPNYYYEGRFFVNGWKSDTHWSLITIGYKVKPQKIIAD
jgi:hypothetical protein